MKTLRVLVCPKCGKKYEEFLSTEEIRGIKSQEIVYTCSCGTTLVLEITAPNLKFVGSGFYETDYKKKEK